MLGRSLGDDPLTNAVFDILVPCIALGIAAVALGLLASATINSTDQAMPILVLSTMVLVVLSSALTLRFTGLLELVQYAVPSFWAHNALAAAVDLNTLSGLAQEKVTNSGSHGRTFSRVNKWLADLGDTEITWSITRAPAV
jgi:hypothetical protein